MIAISMPDAQKGAAMERQELDHMIGRMLDSATMEDLREIADAFKVRSKLIRSRANNKARRALMVGSTGHFPSTARPQYLAGQPVTVEEFRQTKIIVKLNRPMGKFRNARVVTAPGNVIWDGME